MANGWTFLGIVALISFGVFLNGLRFARMTANPFAGRKVFGQDIEGAQLSRRQINWIGRIQMIFAPVFFLLTAIVMFGLFGPVEGVEIIKFN